MNNYAPSANNHQYVHTVQNVILVSSLLSSEESATVPLDVGINVLLVGSVEVLVAEEVVGSVAVLLIAEDGEGVTVTIKQAY